MNNFTTLGIRDELVQKLQEQNITSPTEIQAETIPVLLNGQDVIAQAKTGTGKTFAFLLPILEKIDPAQADVQALIVTPTRELALQVTAELNQLVEGNDDIHVLAVYGGQDVDKQIKRLANHNVQIVIGTPGRLLDHVSRGTIDLTSVSMLILDEADQMLHFGFINEVEDIIRETPFTRQTALFSATISKDVRKLAKRYMKEAHNIRVRDKERTVQEIKQLVVEMTDRQKLEALSQTVDEMNPFLAIIFCRTKRRVSKLYGELKFKGYNVDELHGDLSQAKREGVMKRFRDAKIQLLVATDVAARGLDVEGVTHVFNYDIPQDVESYIHRIGRTGRAGEDGVAITFVAPKDKQDIEMIETGIDMKIERKAVEIDPAKVADRPANPDRKKKADPKQKREQNIERNKRGQRGAGAKRGSSNRRGRSSK